MGADVWYGDAQCCALRVTERCTLTDGTLVDDERRGAQGSSAAAPPPADVHDRRAPVGVVGRADDPCNHVACIARIHSTGAWRIDRAGTRRADHAGACTRGTKRDADRAAEHGAERAAERDAEHGTDPGADPGAEHGTEHGTEHGAEPAVESPPRHAAARHGAGPPAARARS